MATVFETVRSAADELRAAGVDTPQHDAKLLLAEAFHTDLQHVDKAMLMGDGVERLAEKEDAEPAMERFQTMLARRVKREPLQHITGHAPFRYLDLKVGPGVFIPRPETELVVQEGVDWATRNGMYRAKVVDLCAGSGAIGSPSLRKCRAARCGPSRKALRPPSGRGATSTRPRNGIPQSPAIIIWTSPTPRKCRR